jgi:hypothetical protein
METTALTKLKAGGQFGPIVRTVRFIAPGLVTILIGWGTVQFSQGRNAQRLDNVERDLEQTLRRQEFQIWANEQKDMLRSTNQKADNLVTREEFRQFTEQNREQLRDLKEDLRTLKR